MTSLRLRYQTIEFEKMDIHVRTLRDNQQYCDDDGAAEKLGISSATWPFFGIIWDSSLVLAHFINYFDITGKRILEVGCGIGLASLLLNNRLADITATLRPGIFLWKIQNSITEKPFRSSGPAGKIIT